MTGDGYSCLKQVWTVIVGPKIKEMSPSTKEKIRDDVHDAMAEEEEGKLHKTHLKNYKQKSKWELLTKIEYHVVLYMYIPVLTTNVVVCRSLK